MGVINLHEERWEGLGEEDYLFVTLFEHTDSIKVKFESGEV
jgi:hypothetical protein